MTNRVTILKDKFNQSLGLPFKELLPSSAIEQALFELKIKYKKRLFDPIVTLWAFLSQVLDTDKSCHNAVSKVIAYLVGEGVEIPSTDTSAYCQARSRLPEKLLEKLFSQAAQSLSQTVTTEHLWCGRNVLVIDGSTVSMPDTVENQKAYPQPKTQKAGCGFPIAKIGVIFSLVTGDALSPRNWSAFVLLICGCRRVLVVIRLTNFFVLDPRAAVALVIDVLNTHDIKLARVYSISFLIP